MILAAFRKLDDLGRVVLPIELRRQLGIQPGAEVEILVEGGDVILRRWVPRCVICGGPATGLFHGKAVCMTCCATVANGDTSKQSLPAVDHRC